MIERVADPDQPLLECAKIKRFQGPIGGDFPPPPSFVASARALAAWLDATSDASSVVKPAVVITIEEVYTIRSLVHRPFR